MVVTPSDTTVLNAPRKVPQLVASPRVAMRLLLAITLVAKLLWGGAVGVTTNEAYYYLYTVHPDWSYFDHPPMTMWIARLGLILSPGGGDPFSLRLGFALLFVGSTWVMFKWTARWYGATAGLYAALLLNLSGYYAVAGGFASPDGPLLFFSLLTMWSASEAVLARPERTLPWVWVGLAFAGALLSKYHAIFLPMGVAFYVVVTPGMRHLLRRPGPYLALGIAFIGFLPVVVWNANHEWASFVFQGGRAISTGFQLDQLAGAVFGPALCLLPWVWGLLSATLAVRMARFGSVVGMDRLAICLAVVPLAFFIGIGSFRWVMIHWSLIAFISLFALAGAWWARCAKSNLTRSRWFLALMASPLLIGATIAIGLVDTGLVRVQGADEFADARGWESVAAELTARGLLDEPETFLFTSDWRDSARLGFAVRNRVPVLCSSDDARAFAFWSEPSQWVGANGLLVSIKNDSAELRSTGDYFNRVELAAEFPMKCGNRVQRIVRVYRCVGQRVPFPFGYPGHALPSR